VVIGVLQVWLTYWAVCRWTSSAWTGLLGAIMAAISPIAVSHSQFILVDMTGVLFGTWLLGLLARPMTRPGQAVASGALLGLACASKWHFAVWGLPALLGLWLV